MKFTKNRFNYALLAIALTMTAAALIIYPERYSAACLKGFALWAECVLPSLFPFMIVTLLFIKTGLAARASRPLGALTKKLNLPETAPACFVISVCSGYPAGSRAVREFYDGGRLSVQDVKKLAPLCSTSGPLFVIGSVGIKCFGDKSAGFMLFAAHIVSVTAVALIFARADGNKPAAVPLKTLSEGNVLNDCFCSATVSVCMAGAFIAFFTCVSEIAMDFNVMYPLERAIAAMTDENLAEGICRGLIEATGGCAVTAKSASPLALPAAGFMITSGGTSIILQQMCCLSGAGVRAGRFIAIKLLQAVLCFLLLLPFALI